MAEQFTARNGPEARGLFACSARARSSFPVPLSPTSRIGVSLNAARSMSCITARISRDSARIPVKISSVTSTMASEAIEHHHADGFKAHDSIPTLRHNFFANPSLSAEPRASCEAGAHRHMRGRSTHVASTRTIISSCAVRRADRCARPGQMNKRRDAAPAQSLTFHTILGRNGGCEMGDVPHVTRRMNSSH